MRLQLQRAQAFYGAWFPSVACSDKALGNLIHTCGALMRPLYTGSVFYRCPKCKRNVQIKREVSK